MNSAWSTPVNPDLARIQVDVWCKSNGGSSVVTLVESLLTLAGRDGLMGDGKQNASLLAFDGSKWVRSKSVAGATGRARLNEAIDRSGDPAAALSLFFNADGRNGAESPDSRALGATIRQEDGLAHLKLNAPTHTAPAAAGFLTALWGTMDLVAGGAWGGVPVGLPPPWTPRAWWVRPLPSPFLNGPLWLVVAPVEAHRVLARSKQAIALAVKFDEVVVDGELRGSVWHTATTPAGPTVAEAANWIALLDTLGLIQHFE